MKIAGVVVLYRPSMKDLENIDSYINELDELIVIDNSDNCESSNYRKMLTSKDKIELITFPENIGIAKALNMGAVVAKKKGYEWLLTMDQDTRLNTGVIKEMLNYVRENTTSDVGIITPWHNTKLLENKPTTRIDYPKDVMTSGNLVNLNIHTLLNGFKEQFFIDGVDIEYCLRLRKNNFKIIRLNYIEVNHDLGDIMIRKFMGKTYICTNHNYIRNYYMQRNYRYIKDSYGDFEPEFCNVLIHFKSIIFKILMFEKDKYRKIRNILRGIHDYRNNVTGSYPYKN